MVTSSLPKGKPVGRLVVGEVGRRFLYWGSTVQCNSDVDAECGVGQSRPGNRTNCKSGLD